MPVHWGCYRTIRPCVAPRTRSLVTGRPLDYLFPDEFEWDEHKSRACALTRGIDFEFVIRAFADPNGVIVPVERGVYTEKRLMLFGQIEGRLHIVVFTHRLDRIRIISARRANRREIRFHANRTQDNRHL